MFFVPFWPLDHDTFYKLLSVKNEFEFELPGTKRKIIFKLLTQSDERKIDAELKAMKKVSKNTGVDPEMTTRMRKIISSVDGNSEKAHVNNFVNEELFI